MRIAIIGGVAGGASAATRARRMDEKAEITIYEKGPYISYANCGLPYYVGGIIEDRQALLLETPESLWDRFRIAVRVNTLVTAIEPTSGNLKFVQDDRPGEAGFDRLILAPGATPIIPSVVGLERPDVFLVRTVSDALRLRDHLDSGRVTRAVVVGAGFIGLEVAEMLLHREIAVTVVDMAAHVLPPVDADIAGVLESHLHALGVQLRMNSTLQGIHGSIGRPLVELSSGTISTDMVVVGVGVRPSIDLAQSMGLRLGQTGAVQVDSHMQTSHPRVWAAGDAVEKFDLVTKAPRWWPLAGTANKEGRVAGTNAAGGNATFSGSLGTAIMRFGPHVVGVTGLTEKAAQKAQIPYRAIHTVRGNHAGYYPGAHDILIKLLYDPEDGRVLGAQAIGESGVDKRIDVIATAIHGKLGIDDLADLDLAYAPPIGSAKDAVVITGMGAANARAGLVDSVSASELEQWLAMPDRPFLLDVRDANETRETGIIPGAHHIPLNHLRSRLSEVPSDRPIVTYCRSGHRSYVATRILRQHGRRDTYNLSGGITLWGIGHATETPEVSQL